ncbi:MAG: transposase [Candidatus Methanoperedens sp.]
MIFQKTLKIPIHYDTTKSKIGILDRLTARITYTIMQISSLITDDTKLDRKTLRRLVKDSDIVEKTGLSAGFVQQCIDKVIWTWKSHKKLHRVWERKIVRLEKKLADLTEEEGDKKKKTKIEARLSKLMKSEPSQPIFQKKTSCRIDYRTGKIEWSDSKLTSLWMHVSTLEKNKTIDIPLNPSQYHLNQLIEAEIADFEIIKKDKKYYAYVTITKVIEDKTISSIGGIDQGLNRTIAVVLLTEPMPREEHLLDAAKRELLDKYDAIISSLQEAEKWDKLRELRNKRANVSTYHDWCLANEVAEFTEGSLIVIGDTNFGQTQFRGNGMPTLRKRIGKWSYSRQRKFIALKRTERGYLTLLEDEYNTSKRCHSCGSMLTTRHWIDGYSYILCHSCGAKTDADFNAAYNISYKVNPIAVWVYNSGIEYALRCRDDRLKVQMTMEGAKPHASA